MSTTRSRESNAEDRSSTRIVRDLEFPRESVFRMITDLSLIHISEPTRP